MEFKLLCDIDLQLVYYGIYHDFLNTILNTVKSYIYKIHLYHNFI